MQAGLLTKTGTFTNGGGIAIDAGATLDVNSLTHSAGALLQGTGTLDLTGATVAFNGDIDPGAPGVVGTLAVTGNLTLGATSVFYADAAAGPSGDRLNVSGSFTRNGSLVVTPVDGFTPVAPFAFTAVGAGAAPVGTWTDPLDWLSSVVGNTIVVTYGPSGENSWLAGSGVWSDPAKWSRGRVPAGPGGRSPGAALEGGGVCARLTPVSLDGTALAMRIRSLPGRTAGLFAVMVLASGFPRAAENPGRPFVLENGLKVFLFEKRDMPLLHIVTAFDVGSKNESDGTNGLVHLLEHCILFRGESAGRGAAKGADIRGRGAYFNDSTSQDTSIFAISLPAEHAAFALRNQRDILFAFELGPEELEAEKEVILEEFGQMEDDPQRSAADAMFQALFPGHPYGRLVYGRREVVRAATVERLLVFHRRYFVADNCALAVVGDFETAAMERLVREVFGPLPRTGLVPETVPPAAPLKKSVSLRLERDVQDGYLLIGFAAPDYNHADQHAMTVLTEVLGRGLNPLLPSAFKREGASVRTVSMSYLPFRFGGAAVVSIKTDPKDLEAVEREAVDFLKRTRNESYCPKDFPPETEPFAFDNLESAKNQIRFAVGQSEESGLRLAGSMARHMILNTRADPGRFLDRIGKVDSDDLRRAAARYLGHGGYAAVAVAPRKAAKK